MRRPNNAGTVYKLKDPHRRKKWVASITLGYDNIGRRKRRVTTHYTKQEALRELTLYEISPIERPNIKLKELYEEWSARHFKRISKDMQDGYTYAFSKLETLHNIKFNELKTVHFQDLIDKLDLSRSVHHLIKTLTNLLYKYAIEKDIATKNYSDFIRLPKAKKIEKVKFSEESIRILTEHDNDHMCMLILSMIYTGFRPAAFLSLTSENYKPEYNILIGGIKTEAGIDRVIPVHPAIDKYVKYFLSLKGETIFCRKNGSKYSDLKNFRARDYKSTLEKYNIDYLPPMRCRHTFSSLMVKYNVKKLVHTKLMGHTKYSMSADAYSHIDTEDLSKELQKIPAFR